LSAANPATGDEVIGKSDPNLDLSTGTEGRMLYIPRDALSKQVRDVIAKVIVEVGAKILSAK
jgi:hypothetical protein